MRFPYFKLGPRDFAPIVPIKMLGKEGWMAMEAYVDSGASFSIFGSDRADLLGVDYKRGTTVHLVVGDGDSLEVFLHKVSVEFAGTEFVAEIGFSQQLGIGFNLLGRKSFFDRFRICFDDRHRRLDVTPLKSR